MNTTDAPATRRAALIDERWDYDDPAGSEAAFRVLLDEATASGEVDYVLQVRTQIARAQGLQRRFDDAHATLDAVEQELVDETPLARIRFLLERGRTFNSSQEPAKAKPLFVDAWDRASAANVEFYAVDAAHMIAIVSPPEEALAWNERALGVAREAKDERAREWVGSLCNNIGWTYHAMERYDDALAMFEEALRARRAQEKDKEIRIARWCVARCLRSLGRAEESLALQRALRAELTEVGEDDGYVHEEIGECLHALGRVEEARPSFRRAHELLGDDAWLVESDPDRLARWKALARIMHEPGRPAGDPIA